MMSFVIKTIRSLFFSLDKIIYGLIDDVYSLLVLISRTSIFSEQVISEFSSRIYALAGIFMLFKVSMSIINYVINPDDFTDKEKGFASIGKRIVISLVLLVVTPYIFQEAYELQAIILEENTIMNLVFGSSSQNGIPNDDYVQNAGKHIQFTVMYTFMQPNFDELYADNQFPLSNCVNPYVFEGNAKKTRDDSNFIYELTPECFGTYSNDIYQDNGTLSGAFKEYDATGIYQNYAQGIAQQNFSILMRQDLILIKNTDNVYLINYKFFISTAVGIVIVYLFLLFCIDIAARSVKLGFLQMMAPIPILSYIDPKSGKDGMFKKWYQMCLTTYASLFLRLFALYLGIYAITVIGGYTDFVTGKQIRGNWLLDVFMIIGILIFAKQLPKIIEDIFGIKLDGAFKLNPLKKIEEDALGGKQLVGAGKGVAAAGLAGAAAFGTNLIAKKNPFSALAGAVSASGRGLVGGVKGEKFGKNFSASYGGAMKARQDREDRKELGVNAFDIASQKAKQAMGISTPDQVMDTQVKRYDEAIKAGQTAKKRAEAEVDKKADSIRTSTGQSLGALRDKIDILKNMDAASYTSTRTGRTGADALADDTAAANSEYFKERKAITNNYIKRSAEGELNDARGADAVVDMSGACVFTDNDVIVSENVRMMESATSKYSLTDATGTGISVNRSKLGDTIQTLEDAQTTISTSDKFRTSHLVADQTKREKK